MLGSTTKTTQNGRSPAGLAPLEENVSFRSWSDKHHTLMERQAALESELRDLKRELFERGDRATDALAAAAEQVIATGELALPAGNETLRQQIGDLMRHGEVLQRALRTTSGRLAEARDQYRSETLEAVRPSMVEARRKTLKAAILLCQALQDEAEVWPASAGVVPSCALPSFGVCFTLVGPGGVWPASGYELPPLERWARAAVDAGILSSADLKELF